MKTLGTTGIRTCMFAMLLLVSTAALAQDSSALWRHLQDGGKVVLMRHAQTVAGIGDPAGFTLADCATQRNLSDQGRSDARRIGESFRARSIPVAAVRSSRWCRCLETARLAFGSVSADPVLDSVFNDDQAAKTRKTVMLRKAVSQWQGPGNLVLVTHAQNIQALTGISPQSGEMVLVHSGPAGGFDVLGRLPPEAAQAGPR